MTWMVWLRSERYLALPLRDQTHIDCLWPLCDIDVEDQVADDKPAPAPVIEKPIFSSWTQEPRTVEQNCEAPQRSSGPLYEISTSPKSRHASLATPSVRELLKELNVAIADVTGTGKDGRILKEDVQIFAKAGDSGTGLAALRGPSRRFSGEERAQVETRQPLTQIQAKMFKTMTRSLSIPHFSYADEISITSLSKIRQRVNIQIPNSYRLSYLPFIIKAVSLALEDFPLLNSRIAPESENDQHQLIMREKHNVGVAIDTPQGLLVPNIKNVSSLSIMDIAAELSRLKNVANGGNLSVNDLTGGTITVSNIGAIGGTYVAPVIVSNEVAILGIGKARTAPAFDEQDRVVKKEIINFSWSADHRVVDGATMARMAERVRGFIEEPEGMMTRLR